MDAVVPGRDGEHAVFHPEQANCRNAIVFRVDFDGSSGHGDGVLRRNALIRRCDLKVSAGNLKRPRNAAGRDAVVPGFQRQRTIQDADVVFRVDAVSRRRGRQRSRRPVQLALKSGQGDSVVSGLQVQLRFHDTEVVVDMQRIRRSIHRDCPAGENKLVVTDDPALFPCRDGQASRPVDRQVIPREDRAVHARRQVLRREAQGSQPVFTALRQAQEYFVRLLHVKARPG